MSTANFPFAQPKHLAAMGSTFRQQLLADMQHPTSAIELAKRYDMSRQRIGYHIRDLESAGCITKVGERPQRGLTEKLYQVAPCVFAQAPADYALPGNQSRFSLARLVNLLASALVSLAQLKRRSEEANKRLATLALEAELNFQNASQRKAFTEDLLDSVEAVIKKHQQPASEETRSFKLLLGAFPKAD